MEQTIESLEEWVDLTINLLYEEWISGEYTRLSDCPAFEECVVYRKTINYLIEAIYMTEDVEELKMEPITKIFLKHYNEMSKSLN